ncbi:MAG: hypothetical protein AAF393_03055 [Pseudomonadota bacterium]
MTKSTLKQAPLARPVVEPGDQTQVALFDTGHGVIAVDGIDIPLTLRVCPKGGTWTTECPQARALKGDVLSLYVPLEEFAAPATIIWGRKAADGHALVENVVLRCCEKGRAC